LKRLYHIGEIIIIYRFAKTWIYNIFIFRLQSRQIRKKISPAIKNRDVFIVGSGPNLKLDMYNENMQIICINGSAAQPQLQKMQPPNLTFLDNELLDLVVNKIKNSRSEIINDKLLKNLDLGIVISTQSNNSLGGPLDQLESKWIDHITTDKKFRKQLCKKLTKQSNLETSRRGILSTGGFALAFVVYFGAKSVLMSGFSFYKSPTKDDSDKFYKERNSISSMTFESGIDTRSHSLADSFLISCLVLMGFKIESNDTDLLPILHNWGSN